MPSSSTSRLGILRLEIDGPWSARDFGEFFLRLDRVYSRFSAAELALRDGDRLNQYSYYAWRRDWESPEEVINRLEQRARLRLGPLDINRVELASPGAVEVIGALNPLKVVADGIKDWRHENTIRGQTEIAENLENRRLDQEQQRIDAARQQQQNEFLLGVLDRLEGVDSPIREILIAELLAKPREELSRIVTDIRVTDAEIRELSDAPE